MADVADITVQYVNFPKPGKKNGSIKTSEGLYFWGKQPMLSQFAQGEVCRIEFTTSEDGQWKTITKKIGGTPKQSGPIPIPQIRTRTNPVDSEQISVMAMLKEFIRKGDVDLETTAIVTAINVCRDAYRFTFGGLEQQRNEKDINDEILI